MFSVCKNLTGLPGSEFEHLLGGCHDEEDGEHDGDEREASSSSAAEGGVSIRGGAGMGSKSGGSSSSPSGTRRSLLRRGLRAPPPPPPPPPRPYRPGERQGLETSTTLLNSLPPTTTTSLNSTASPTARRTTAAPRRLLLPLRVNASAQNEQLYSSPASQQQVRQRQQDVETPYLHGDENAGFYNRSLPRRGDSLWRAGLRQEGEGETGVPRSHDSGRRYEGRVSTNRITLWPTIPARPLLSSSPSSMATRRERRQRGQEERRPTRQPHYQQQQPSPFADETPCSFEPPGPGQHGAQKYYYGNNTNKCGRDLTAAYLQHDRSEDDRFEVDSNGVSPCSSTRGDESWKATYVVSPLTSPRSSSAYSLPLGSGVYNHQSLPR
ncbi:uncharacterized protein B0I36DRAFT_360458 [Microdochium trichocladiopsis]|uniref:Uncharacterized protein n=1 Tax=Microdochium trichocladiopsis TaxID=1682393 RepID=A0A9P8YDK9_9PEZI|nr:uncharacterized protein B0I36DRAFT_360458 [Microdochium trichocladiopsis]KAH7035006.1 hypothetical protein B0I36DRAFT_360458 [Microdochium trichocladiopsis]